MENTSIFTTRVAVNTLLASWILAAGLLLLNYQFSVGAWLYYAFFIGHGLLVTVMRERITSRHKLGMLSRDYVIVISSPCLGPLVWYYRWKHNMVALEKSSGGFSLRVVTVVILISLLGILPLLVWVLKTLRRE